MKFPAALRLVDLIVIAFAVVLTVGSALLIYRSGNSLGAFLIEAPKRSWTYPNDAEALVEVQGAIGVSTAEIHDGSIRIISSPCANQTCVAAGSISRTGQWIACLPNQVFIHVEGKEQSDDSIDGATW
jgi:hypothetical protein